ncbi:MAG TPA: D-aminoacyl-tRNA deacylase [Ignavibacteriaceae bacterium]|nr:D-aminoacyl-tRNA deacylase [Ignavibacteriaceae bacterium]
MRVVVQRVSEGGVEIESDNYSQSIGKGMVILLGIKAGDSEMEVNYLADKCSSLRIFPPDGLKEAENEKMNYSIKEIKGEALVISQFTLYGDASRGNRPGFTDAARPEEAAPLYEKFVSRMKQKIGDEKVKTGIFGAMMNVKIINDGPVTIIIDSK